MRNKMNNYVIVLGSNLSSEFGSSAETLKKCVGELKSFQPIQSLLESNWYISSSFVDEREPRYVNVGIRFSTSLKPKDLINFTFGALASTLLCLTILALIAAPIFVMIFAPGFYLEPLKKELAIDILQITFPYLFFISLVALAGSILNSYERFSLPALNILSFGSIQVI